MPEINRVLRRLGINAQQYNGHENHFYVDFRNPARVTISSTNSMVVDQNAATTELNISNSMGQKSGVNELEPLLALLANEFNTTKEDLIMFAIPNPDLPAQYEIAEASVKKDADKSVGEMATRRAIGVCLASTYRDSDKFDKDYSSQSAVFREYFFRFEPQAGMPPRNFSPDVRLVESPTHGKIVEEVVDGYAVSYYLPEVGYLGADKAVFEVSYEGKTVKMVYAFKVTKYHVGANETQDLVCKGKDFWKISTNSGSDFQTIVTFTNTISEAIVKAFDGFSDLPGASLGQTKGEGHNAKITLDTDAAGYGWFIDSSPQTNDEFLPTAEAKFWKANAGSAAEGKMDMLSVLLHEYGHSLVLEHSTAAGDAMAATLKPGERRLFTVEELAQLDRRNITFGAQLESLNTAPFSPQNPTPNGPRSGWGCGA